MICGTVSSSSSKLGLLRAYSELLICMLHQFGLGYINRIMFLFVVVVFGKHQYRIFQPNISTEYSPMAGRTIS